MPRLAIAATALLALATSAAAAPSSKKVLVCGARQQGVGGEMAKLLNTTAGVQRADDCAAACAALTGCTSYQWCGFGSYNGTCAWPDKTKPQAGKGDCLLGSGGWRQSGSGRDVGGWTVGTGCMPMDAPAEPAATAGDDEVVAPALPPPPPTPRATRAPAAPVAADEPAVAAAPVATTKPAGWANTAGGAAVPVEARPLTDVVTPVRTPVARGAPAPAGAKPTVPPRAVAPVDDGMTVAAAPAVRAPAPAPAAAAPKKPTAAPAAAAAAPAKKGAPAVAAPAPAPAAAAAGGKRLAGTALELQPDLSRDECRALCESDKACRGFSWCAAPGGCGTYGARLCQPMTFTGPPRYVEGDGWTSGLKEGTPGAATAKSIEA